MKFLTGEPAVFLPEIRSLVIADLHIGFDHELAKAGIIVPHQTDKMKERIEKLLRGTKARRIIILGDVKHRIPGTSWREERDIPEFFSSLTKLVDVHVTLGNHDTSLASLLDGLNVNVHSSRGFRLKGYGFFHGHAWPSKSLLECKCIFMGHTHPAVELKDRFGYRLFTQVWLILNVNRRIGSKYGVKLKEDLKLVVLPAFNRLVGSCILNARREEELLGPILRSEFVDLSKGKVYTLDGIELGTLADLRFDEFPLL